MIYSVATLELKEILQQFYAEEKQYPVWLISYKTLGPDSCIWQLGDDYEDPRKTFAVYLEDYVTSLGYIKDRIRQETQGKNIHLVPVLKPKSFGQSKPVKASVTYTQPDDDEFMVYAAELSYYFVFLASYETK